MVQPAPVITAATSSGVSLRRRSRAWIAWLLVASVALLAVGYIVYRNLELRGPAYQVKDIATGTGRYSEGSFPTGLTAVGGRVFFSADDGPHGSEHWISDGTAPGTFMVKDIIPGPHGGFGDEGSLGDTTVAIGEVAYFFGDDGHHGYELWRSDGTQAGTAMVKDVYPGERGTGEGLVDAAGTLLFGADDATHIGLWKSDGTAAGTLLVKTTWHGARPPRLGPVSPEPWGLTVVGHRTFFFAYQGPRERALWMSDGTRAGTVPVSRLPNGAGNADLRPLIGSDGDFLFTFSRKGAWELWRSDGTRAGTMPLQRFHETLVPQTPAVTEVDDIVYFAMAVKGRGDELWRSDGAPSGTFLAATIPGRTGYAYGYPIGSLIDVEGTLYMTVEGYDGNNELWRSDGTSAGSTLVRELPMPDDFHLSPPELTVAGGTLYFANGELWRSDGSAGGTYEVQDLRWGSHPSLPDGLTVAGDTLFFTAAGDPRNVELWAMPLPRG